MAMELSTQIGAAAACAYMLQKAQRSNLAPWITQHTDGINRTVRATLALAATLGISYVWNGDTHTLTIVGLSPATIGIAFWHWFTQYAMTEGWGKVINLPVDKDPKSEAKELNVGGD